MHLKEVTQTFLQRYASPILFYLFCFIFLNLLSHMGQGASSHQQESLRGTEEPQRTIREEDV